MSESTKVKFIRIYRRLAKFRPATSVDKTGMNSKFESSKEPADDADGHFGKNADMRLAGIYQILGKGHTKNVTFPTE